MTNFQWEAFCSFREEFKNQVKKWSEFSDELRTLQKNACKETNTPFYPIETPIVYNRTLDEITTEDEIKLIIIGDNPGKDEQLLKNNKYLVGQAGKLAEGFFEKHRELGINFRKNTIILNKTPIHSAKTAHLRIMQKENTLAEREKISDSGELFSKDELYSNGELLTKNSVDFGCDQFKRAFYFQKLLEETQIFMAKKTCQLQKFLKNDLWLVGYSELKEKGIFLPYRNTIKQENPTLENIYVFQHFSMNRFSIDLSNFMKKNNLPLKNSLKKLGKLHCKEIFEQS